MLTENFSARGFFQSHAILLPPVRKARPNFWKHIANLLNPVSVFFRGVDFIELDEEGNPQPSRQRLEKMEREMKFLEKAMQYALAANKNDYFPCFSCAIGVSIFLKKKQIWKYGVTTKGEKGRYIDSLHRAGFLFVPQFHGNIEECLREEKRKIYFYAVLPENLERTVPLLRPPGNKQDN